ncbi:hypothetical protein LTR95_004369 [Oleoguttula sp. CCFEE 5521]
MPLILQRLDQQISEAFSQWNLLTTLLALAIAGFIAYPIIFSEEPDTHPLLLARQSVASPVRRKNESATYRAPEIPHGYPLKSGLNVRDEGEPKWKSGRDGDLRDIWREVMRGGKNDADGKEVPAGLVMSVFGKDQPEEHDLEQLNWQIDVMGRWLSGRNGACKRVAIYLPNSVEYLIAIFACAFWGNETTPILLPFNLPHARVYELLRETKADTIIAAAGSLPLEELAARSKGSIHTVIEVVEQTSQHMDWKSTPEAVQGKLTVEAWHVILQDQGEWEKVEMPRYSKTDPKKGVVAVYQPSDVTKEATITTFTSANIIAAVSGLLNSLPLRQRLSPADLVLPADSFNSSYTLCWTLAALYTHTSLAITSVASAGVDFSTVSRSVSPTVVVASAATMAGLHEKEPSGITSKVQKSGLFSQEQTLAAGRMPVDTYLWKFLAPSASTTAPGKLRLILTSSLLADDGKLDPPILTSTMLSDLRIFTHSRIAYALASSKVAGMISASHVFDYRRTNGEGAAKMGSPVGCLEIKLANSSDAEVGLAESIGELVVTGPSVVGGDVRTGGRCTIGSDGCLSVFSFCFTTPLHTHRLFLYHRYPFDIVRKYYQTSISVSTAPPTNSASGTRVPSSTSNEQTIELISATRRSVATQTLLSPSVAPSDTPAAATGITVSPSDLAAVMELTARVAELTYRLQAHQTMLEDVEIALHQRLDRLEARLESASGGTGLYRDFDDYITNGGMLLGLADDPHTFFAKVDAQMGADEAGTTRRPGRRDERTQWETGNVTQHETSVHGNDSTVHYDSSGVALSEHDEERMDFDEYMHGVIATDEQRCAAEHTGRSATADIAIDDGLLSPGVPLASDTELLDALSHSPAASMPDLEDAYSATGDALVPDDAVLQSLSDDLVDVQLLANIPHPLGLPTPLVDLGTLPLPPSTAEALLPFPNPVTLAEVTEPLRLSGTPHRPGAAEEERIMMDGSEGRWTGR